MKSCPPTDCESLEAADLLADEPERRKELKDFVYAVTHDVRSPLVNVRGLSRELRDVLGELLKDRVGDDAEPASASLSATETVVMELLEHMETSISRMDGMMNQLAGFSRAACGELEFTAVDLGGVMARVVEQKAPLIEATDCCVDVGSLPTVRADAIAMEIVFGELLSNALVFLSDDRRGRVSVFAESEGEGVRIVVRDNGRGIEERDFERIFRPFRRVGPLDRPGAGMGLAVVKTLVGRHEGSVRCASDLGEGSVFTVVLGPHQPFLFER